MTQEGASASLLTSVNTWPFSVTQAPTQLAGSQGLCPHEHPQTQAEHPAQKVTSLPFLCRSEQTPTHRDERPEVTGATPGRG